MSLKGRSRSEHPGLCQERGTRRLTCLIWRPTIVRKPNMAKGACSDAQAAWRASRHLERARSDSDNQRSVLRFIKCKARASACTGLLDGSIVDFQSQCRSEVNGSRIAAFCCQSVDLIWQHGSVQEHEHIGLITRRIAPSLRALSPLTMYCLNAARRSCALAAILPAFTRCPPPRSATVHNPLRQPRRQGLQRAPPHRLPDGRAFRRLSPAVSAIIADIPSCQKSDMTSCLNDAFVVTLG